LRLVHLVALINQEKSNVYSNTCDELGDSVDDEITESFLSAIKNWGHKAEKLLVQRIGEAMEELPRELEDWISENDSLGG
jgi:hypothetical protein